MFRFKNNPRPMNSAPAIAAILICAALVAACDKDLDASIDSIIDSPANISESAAATIGSIANDSEADPLTTSSIDPVLNGSEYLSQATCSYNSARGACSSSAVSTVNWNGCALSVGNGYSVTFNGGWTNTYDAAGTCTTSQSGPLPTGHSVTRTTSSFIARIPGGTTVTVDTLAHKNYLGTNIPATGVVTSTSGTTRTITVNGAHRVLRSAKGTPWFDHSLTSTAITVTGTRATQDRTVNGAITLYHNLAKFTATSTFNNVTWGSNTCCYPTSGSVSTTFTGTTTGTTTMTYGGCGTATFVDTKGATSTQSLKLCE
jgi:hypothetical protein